MELDYFISGSRIEQSFVKDKWLETTPSATRSFNDTKKYNLTGASGNQDFSLFFTFDKANSTKGNLFSNFSGNGGYSIAFNSNNELFVKTFDGNYFCETFDKVRLGKKNCLGIVKNNRSIVLYKYNLQGTGISQQQAVIFPRTTNISGDGYYLGYSTNVASSLAIQGVSGTFDQMLLLNTAVTKEQALSIFSGFQPYSKSTTPTYTKTYEASGYDRRTGSFITDLEIQSIATIFNQISDQLPNSSNYVGLFSGIIDAGLDFATWSGVYAQGTNLACYSTGSLIGPVYGTGTYTSVGSQGYTFLDSIYSSMNSSGEKMVSHFITVRNNPTGNLEDFFSYNLYQKYTSGISNSLTLSGDYKTGFFMEGVLVNQLSGITLLSNVSGEKYSNIGYEGLFDRTIGLFSVNGLTNSGHRVFWGESGKISGYSIESGYLDMLNTTDSDIHPLFYDLYSGDVNFVHTTLLGYATGKFDPDTSITFTGLNSWSQLYRMRKTDYLESCSYHLAHSKAKILPTGVSSVYLNTQNYWTS